MVNFIIPGFYEHKYLNLNLIKLIKNNPELFQPNINIGAVYGNFQFCIWDGGRIFTQYKQATQEDVISTMIAFNNLNTPIRFVFTNNQIEENDCYDRFCNMILQECQNGKNEIVINNSILESYILQTYPQYPLISSTTKCLNNQNLLKQELKNTNYTMVCLDYNLNKNFSFLESLSKEEKNKCEFLINPICGVGCPNRAEHYKLNSLFSKTYGKAYQLEHCNIYRSPLNPSSIQYNNQISSKDLYEIYVPMGFKHFKIEGRTWSDIDLAIFYAEYMALPCYKNQVISLLLNETQEVFKNVIS